MKELGWLKGIWVLAVLLGLTGASCTTQVTTDNRPSAPDSRPSTLKEPDAATKANVQVAYGKLPLSFEANQGQTDEQVKFLSRGSGYTLFLSSAEAVLTLRKPHKNSLAPVSDSPASPQPYKNSLAPVGGERVRVRGLNPEQIESTLLRMKLVGTNSNLQVVGLGIHTFFSR